ncbi:MAG: SO2930 family diheme c-type cytochrome [Pseudomonadota bacterium]|nr:SO2930 family diheme c-type cytochrome [Pseudomonadota bacterium]
MAASALPPPRINQEAILGVAQLDGEVRKFPRTLSEFGFFRDAAARQPAPNVIGYELNTPLYSDGADKLRYIFVPTGEPLLVTGDGLLEFPVGSAIIKTFAFGEGDDQRFIETRVLLHRADGWVALPYRWNEEQTEARLALAGARIPITRPDGTELSYRIPNKNECKTCHQKDGEVIPIGPKARNLSHVWLASMQRIGRLSGWRLEFPDTDPEDRGLYLPTWPYRDHVTPEAGARAYLDVNCAHCHQPGGSASNSGLDLRWEQDDPHAIGIAKPPVAAGRGAGGFEVSIAPGDPDRSIMVHRMASTEPGVAMPELGRSTTDDAGIEIVRRWIAAMPAAKETGK